MYTEDDLLSAVQAGALSADAADALRSHAASRRATPVVDEEHFRLVTGFNDIFVVIACVLMLVSVAWIGNAAAHWVGSLAVAACAWGLAEFFVRKRHMALPAIVLLVAFVGGLFTSIFSVAGDGQGLMVAAGALLAAVGAWLHWQRFHVPITVAAGCAALVGAVWALLLKSFPTLFSWMSLVILVGGVVVFIVALRWDASDTQRRTRRADVAFWLHLLAAPLLVHPLFAMLSLAGDTIALWQALVVLLAYGAIAAVSLVIDRRALMVSALGYVLYTFSALLKQYGNVGLGFAITALALGAALLLLSAFWHRTRSALLRKVPLAVQRYIAPLQ
ncbi:hypothetical protein [Rhodoferax saidenbachensis]|uniref:DUF2157 domain-containing protein n=1 Tax=Rhodoferax saidenbachensis TaxID=1484693 RepID=A0ABU1ZLC6_9BURK|nr:hypothetical protein [Rhodoferax saidenbachensis]MDR7306347.1 hypothetical protein [Rhodoferax saidenbachensis]